tara:strand:+ start:100 stop:423 length:324 start_codon:yes stop_codon:yes gene_type:complete
MKKMLFMATVIAASNLWAILPYGTLQDQAAKLLEVDSADLYNVSEQVIRTTSGSMYKLTFSYDVESYDSYGYEVLTYNCVATAKGLPVLTGDTIECELDEGILFDEF